MKKCTRFRFLFGAPAAFSLPDRPYRPLKLWPCIQCARYTAPRGPCDRARGDKRWYSAVVILNYFGSWRMLNEAAARSRSAADVGGEFGGGVIAAYDNATTSKIHPGSCHSRPGRTHSAIIQQIRF